MAVVVAVVKPDSGERERELASLMRDNARMTEAGLVAEARIAELERLVCIEPSLAQRILAALENWEQHLFEFNALAAELRERLPK